MYFILAGLGRTRTERCVVPQSSSQYASTHKRYRYFTCFTQRSLWFAQWLRKSVRAGTSDAGPIAVFVGPFCAQFYSEIRHPAGRIHAIAGQRPQVGSESPARRNPSAAATAFRQSPDMPRRGANFGGVGKKTRPIGRRGDGSTTPAN